MKKQKIGFLLLVLILLLGFSCGPDLKETITERVPIRPHLFPSEFLELITWENLNNDNLNQFSGSSFPFEVPEEPVFTITSETLYYNMSNNNTPLSIPLQIEGGAVNVSKVYYKLFHTSQYYEYAINQSITSYNLDLSVNNDGGCGYFDLYIVMENSDGQLSNELVITVGLMDTLVDDCYLPEVTIEPPNGSSIKPNSTIILTFNKRMATDTLEFDGLMAEELDDPLWQQTRMINDTLIITPIETWSEGLEQTLIVEVKDKNDGFLCRVVLTYIVDDGPPVPTVEPPSGSFINDLELCIEINFHDNMLPDTLTAEGVLFDESGGPEWTSIGERDNNILTFCPATEWTENPSLSMTFDASDVAGNYLNSPMTITYYVDGTRPFALSVDPPSPTDIHVSETITVTFNEIIDVDTLELGGALSSSAKVEWTQDIFPNDTLVLRPTSFWPAGGGKTLTINCSDRAGNPLSATVSLNYNVVYYHHEVDDTADMGMYCSMRAVGNGDNLTKIYMSYYNNDDGDLEFAYSGDNATSWDYTTIDGTGGDDVGQYTSMDIIPSGLTKIYISYYDVTNTRLKFARSLNNGSTWPFVQTIDNTASVGKFNDIAVLGDGSPASTTVYASYYDADDGDLRFARSTDNGTTWPTTMDVDSMGTGLNYAYTGIDALGNGGATSRVYIVYYSGGDLKFAKSTNNGTSWTTLTIDSNGTAGDHADILAVDYGGASNRLYVSYYNATASSLMFAKSLNDGSTWTTKTIDSLQIVGWYTSIDTLGAGDTTKVFISYLHQSNGDLKLAFSNNDGDDWSTPLIADDGGGAIVGQYSSLDVLQNLDGNPVAYIGYYDFTNRLLKLSH